MRRSGAGKEKNAKDHLHYRRYHGSGKNHGLPDLEKEAAGLCIFGRGLVLGYGSFSSDGGDKDDGFGKRGFPAEPFYPLLCL